MNVLMFGIEGGRYGAALLVRELHEAGIAVAALCPAGHALAATRFTARHFPLPATRSARRMAAMLAAAIATCRPRLIVPTDEQSVALLHALVRGGPKRGGLDAPAVALIAASLGAPEQFDAMLFKSHTMDLARHLGVRVPSGRSVGSADEAAAVAARLGYPVFVKSSFGWAGQAVALCRDAAAVVAALPPPPGRLAPARRVLRRVLHRDWYPTGVRVDVQQAIEGRPAMYCLLAWQGRVLAGFAGIPQATHSATGPSTRVWLGADAQMAEASAAMVAGLGATGFIGFDFMIEDATGRAHLLECNARPIQVGHLGKRIGADLAAALAAAFRGDEAAATAPSDAMEAALFPQEWQRDPASAARAEAEGTLTVPWDDPGLFAHMVAAGAPQAREAIAAQGSCSLRIQPVSRLAHSPGLHGRPGAVPATI